MRQTIRYIYCIFGLMFQIPRQILSSSGSEVLASTMPITIGSVPRMETNMSFYFNKPVMLKVSLWKRHKLHSPCKACILTLSTSAPTFTDYDWTFEFSFIRAVALRSHTHGTEKKSNLELFFQLCQQISFVPIFSNTWYRCIESWTILNDIGLLMYRCIVSGLVFCLADFSLVLWCRVTFFM